MQKNNKDTVQPSWLNKLGWNERFIVWPEQRLIFSCGSKQEIVQSLYVYMYVTDPKLFWFSFYFRIATNKLILLCIILVELAILAAVVYLRFFKKSKSKKKS